MAAYAAWTAEQEQAQAQERPVIWSLCTGYGGLDMAVAQVFGGRVALVCDKDPAVSVWLACRMPHLPNLGDLTSADWAAAAAEHGRPDIITAGFPCQPVSNAGKRRGAEDERWIWPDIAAAIRVLRPRWVVLENVSALLVRGFAAVQADLAAVGYLCAWVCLRASDVGAPHGRERVFVVAFLPAADPDRPASGQRRVAASGEAAGGRASADPGGPGGARPAGPADAPLRGRPERDGRDDQGAPGPGDAAAGDDRGSGRLPGGGPAGPADAADDRPGRHALVAGDAAGDARPGPGADRGLAGAGAAAADPGGGQLQRRGDAGGGGGAEGPRTGEAVQRERGRGAARPGGGRARAAADPDSGGRGADEPDLPAGQRDAGGRAAADALGAGPEGAGDGICGPGPGGRPGARGGRRDAADGGRGAAADAGRDGREGIGGDGVAAEGRPAEARVGRGPAGGGVAAADPAGGGRHLGDAGPAGLLGRPDAGPGGAGPAPVDAAADPAGGARPGRAPDEGAGPVGRVHAAGTGQGGDGGPGAAEAAVDWQQYGPAVERWEAVTGQRAPHPVRPSRLTKKRIRDCAAVTGLDGWAAAEMVRRGWWGAQLDPAFVEWMMGVVAGWVTDVPGLSRNDVLKILGNGVVPLQAIEGIGACLEDLALVLDGLLAA